MKKNLTALVVTHNNDAESVSKKFRQRIAHMLPEGTLIDYAVNGYESAGAFDGTGARQALVSTYDLVVLSPIIAELFGVPSVIDRTYRKPSKKAL